MSRPVLRLAYGFRRRFACWAVLFVFLSTSTSVGLAAGSGKDTLLMVQILLRALAYDRNLSRRTVGDEIALMVVYRPDQDSSVKLKNELIGWLRSMPDPRLANKRMTVSEHVLTTSEALRQEIESAGVAALFVTVEADERDLAKIMRVSRAVDVASLACAREHIEEGLSIGVEIVADKPRLFVNLPASKAEGLNLSGAMLRLAEVIR